MTSTVLTRMKPTTKLLLDVLAGRRQEGFDSWVFGRHVGKMILQLGGFGLAKIKTLPNGDYEATLTDLGLAYATTFGFMTTRPGLTFWHKDGTRCIHGWLKETGECKDGFGLVSPRMVIL